MRGRRPWVWITRWPDAPSAGEHAGSGGGGAGRTPFRRSLQVSLPTMTGPTAAGVVHAFGRWARTLEQVVDMRTWEARRWLSWPFSFFPGAHRSARHMSPQGVDVLGPKGRDAVSEGHQRDRTSPQHGEAVEPSAPVALWHNAEDVQLCAVQSSFPGHGRPSDVRTACSLPRPRTGGADSGGHQLPHPGMRAHRQLSFG